MSLFSLHHEVPCQGEVLFDSNGFRRFSYGGGSSYGLKHRTMGESNTLRRDCRMKSYIKSIPSCLSQRGRLCLVRASSETKITKKRLKLLDSYFGKLQSDDDEKPSISRGDKVDRKAEVDPDEKLGSLSVYLDKLQNGVDFKRLVSSNLEVVKSQGGSVPNKLRKTTTESNNSPFQQLDDYNQSEDTQNFYAVSIY